MAVTEIVRMAYAANWIWEEASKAVGLSKRSAVALAIVDAADGTMRNEDLQNLFVEHNISTAQSAKKDASTVKGELLEEEFIKTVGRVSVFAITDEGKEAVAKIYDALTAAINNLQLDSKQRAILRHLARLPARRPVKNETGSPPGAGRISG